MNLETWQAVVAGLMLLTGGGGIAALVLAVPQWKKSKAERENLTALTAASFVGTSRELVEQISDQLTATLDQLARAGLETAALRDTIGTLQGKVHDMTQDLNTCRRELAAYHDKYGPLAV